ncbi:hypothetical protein AQUSIP_09840 [Aquicella siphonis]|uniref:Protein kinase domain-containing protein n=1 Tax=Aquicella siphonis TaxID=254247 RepID=A0A5E4PFS1_9COXI|nr:protein kinase family protein [Aquicella siphonis]VVC75694.1 hypothetical protein AQUSIP_09840 [Aquicella siphonis]
MHRSDNFDPTLFGSENKKSSAGLPAVRVKPIPYFPSQGDIADITDAEHCALIPHTEVATILTNIENIRKSRIEREDDRYAKNMIGARFNIVQKDKEFYAIYRLLGKGASGRVKAVQNIRTGKWRAMKILPVAPQIITSEQEMLTALVKTQSAATEHKNLLLLGESTSQEPIGKRDSAVKNPFRLTSLRPDKNEIQWNMLMDLAEGVPVNYFTDKNTCAQYVLPTHYWLQIALDMIQALKDLHHHPAYPLLHCDIKPDNIIYDMARKRAKLIDVARSLPKDSKGICSGSVRGSFTHWTPAQRIQWRNIKTGGSVANDEMLFSESADIHALLITLAELFGLFEPPPNPKSSNDFLKFLNTFNPDTTYVVKKDHPLYQSNTRIGDQGMREKILDFLHESTSHPPESTPTLDAMTGFFTSMRIACLTFESRIKVGILDANHYLELKHEEKMKLCASLAAIQEVQLVDTAEHTDYEYMKIRWELQKMGINVVGTHVYIAREPTQLKEMIQVEYNSGRLKDSFEFHDVNALTPVKPNHFALV